MRTTLRHISAAAVTIFSIAACSDSSSSESTSPNASSKLRVELSLDADTILEGASKFISARVTDITGNLRVVPVTWTSTDPTVAAVSAGSITGISSGTTTIVASAGGGADSATIVVAPLEAYLDVQPSAAIVALGDTINFTATFRDKNGNVVQVPQARWNSSDTVAARFVNGGALVATAEGEVSISAQSAYRRGSGSVKVFKSPVASVSIAPSSANVYKGARLELTVILRDQHGREVEADVSFRSSDPSKATVDQDGVVIGVSAGNVIITATSEGKTGAATITVLGTPAASVALSVPDTVPVGVEAPITATPMDAAGTPLTGRTITYQSANPQVAAVNNITKTVKGISSGTTTISAIVDGVITSKRLAVSGRLASALSITPGAPSITVGQTAQLVASVLDQMGTEMSGQPVSWSSGNAAIAAVSAAGLVTAVSSGSTIISAQSGTLSASVVVSVVNAPVASVQVSPSTVSLVLGAPPVALTATALNASGGVMSGRVATWSSQNPAVASVNSLGIVSAVGAGSTLVTATIEGKSASVTVTVGSAPAAPVASVTVTLSPATIDVGQSSQAGAVLKDAQGNALTRAVEWSSSNPSLATVNSAGQVTALGGGTVVIIGRSEGVSGAATLTVNTPTAAPVAQVIFTAPSHKLTVGQAVQSVVTLKDAQGNILTGRTIAYKTDKPSVLTISATGLISAVGVGETDLWATSGGVTGGSEFLVAGGVGVASITVTPASAALAIGQTSQQTAVARDAQGNVLAGTTFTWTTTNPSVATVNSSGLVSAVGVGSATISAAASGITGSMSVSVTAAAAPVTSVSIALSSGSITVNATSQASVTLRDAQGNTLSGRSVTYSSGNTSIATVSSSGLVTGLATGSTQIRATSEGITGSATLTVTSAPAAPTGAIPTILSILGATKSVTETATLGGSFSTYDQLFTQYLPTSEGWIDNYYDRAVVYYARYARTNDAGFLTRGNNMAVMYRQQFLEPNTYGIQPHWAQLRGLELHYRLTGDTLSRRAVVGVFAHALLSYSMPLWGPKADIENPQSEYMENRIQARVLQGALSAYRMNASYTRPDGTAVRASEWPSRLRDMLNKILSTQKTDGSYAWVQICGGQLNYMVGMLNDVLIEYYRDFEADPRIPVAIEKANEYLWTTQWISNEQAFKYASVHCAPNQFGVSVGGLEPAGDLNGLMIASFGWLYQRTGDPKWKTRGDAIMSGIVYQKWAGSYASSKQFNQAFAESYRYLGWR